MPFRGETVRRVPAIVNGEIGRHAGRTHPDTPPGRALGNLRAPGEKR